MTIFFFQYAKFVFESWKNRKFFKAKNSRLFTRLFTGNNFRSIFHATKRSATAIVSFQRQVAIKRGVKLKEDVMGK